MERSLQVPGHPVEGFPGGHEGAAMGSYVEAGEVRTYYEIHGDGAPVVLLHGGLATIDSFAAQTPALAEHYRVYLPERRGHGRTADVAGPFTYGAMASDTVAFMEAVGVGPAHLVGWSDGAVVAALVALERPDLVRRLVLIGQYLHLDGAIPQVKALFDSWTADDVPAPIRGPFDALSPDGPEHFPVVFEKLTRMWREEPTVASADLAQLAAPTLVMVGDDDWVTLEHAIELYRSLPDGQLAVCPGSSHGLPMEKPEVVNRLILDFLAPQQADKLMSLTQHS
jgi:pimeloyl-ACP methyl ester carboxylesterase